MERNRSSSVVTVQTPARTSRRRRSSTGKTHLSDFQLKPSMEAPEKQEQFPPENGISKTVDEKKDITQLKPKKLSFKDIDDGNKTNKSVINVERQENGDMDTQNHDNKEATNEDNCFKLHVGQETELTSAENKMKYAKSDKPMNGDLNTKFQEINLESPKTKTHVTISKVTNAENQVTTAPKLKPLGIDMKSNSLAPTDGGLGRSRRPSMVSMEPSPRALRLRKSIVAKSLSSLTPVYVDQILPAEQRIYPQITYERTRGPGYLYIISESTITGLRGNLYKVGVTNDLKMRLRDLQNGNPRPLIPELLLKVHSMERIEDHVEDVLREYAYNINGGKGWYKAQTEDNGRNVVFDLIEEIKERPGVVEIPPEKFKDYMNYFINFECSI